MRVCPPYTINLFLRSFSVSLPKKFLLLSHSNVLKPKKITVSSTKFESGGDRLKLHMFYKHTKLSKAQKALSLKIAMPTLKHSTTNM
jgi:hypothetical protein